MSNWLIRWVSATALGSWFCRRNVKFLRPMPLLPLFTRNRANMIRNELQPYSGSSAANAESFFYGVIKLGWMTQMICYKAYIVYVHRSVFLWNILEIIVIANNILFNLNIILKCSWYIKINSDNNHLTNVTVYLTERYAYCH